MRARTRPCPGCGSADDSRVFAERNVEPAQLDRLSYASRKTPEYLHHRLVSCPGCGLVYASPAPAAEELVRAYQDAGFDAGEESGRAAEVYAEELGRFLEALPDRRGALDIGAGDGAFLERLAAGGFTELVGLEPSAEPVRAAKPAVRSLIRRDLFDPAAFPPASLSLVTCFQTLEHVPDPRELCRGARAVLRPGGALFVVCHNLEALSARVLGRKSPIFDVEHLQLFAPGSLRALLERSGFAKVEVWPIFNRYPLHYWTRLLPLPRGLKDSLLPALRASGLGRLMVTLPAGNMAAVGFRLEP
ncbi:MAG: class I SAM-dependent methyltransferase [Elusimicrobia bacterium]|nr:class I SAM-dependent methyltransferase [Elusimicrobiota bacterium]